MENFTKHIINLIKNSEVVKKESLKKYYIKHGLEDFFEYEESTFHCNTMKYKKNTIIFMINDNNYNTSVVILDENENIIFFDMSVEEYEYKRFFYYETDNGFLTLIAYSEYPNVYRIEFDGNKIQEKEILIY